MNIKKLHKIKAFNFLSFQGMIFTLSIITGLLIVPPLSIYWKTKAFFSSCVFVTSFCITMPFLILYSFITFFLLKQNLLKNKTSPIFTIITIGLTSFPYLMFKDVLKIGFGDIGLGMVLIWGMTQPINLILFLLFTLIPFLIMLKKQNNEDYKNYENSIFSNLYFKIFSLIGIFIYLINIFLTIVFLVAIFILSL